MTFTLDTKGETWEVYFTAPCGNSGHVATIHEPLSDNPGIEIHVEIFGINGLQHIIDMVKDAKDTFGR